MEIRTILPADNESLAKIIRSALVEFGANHLGTVYYDPSTDTLYELFRREQSAYFVAVLDGKIIGGGGIFPNEGLPDKTCELVKMYLIPEARGKGFGRLIIDHCIECAKEFGFKMVYIESMPELSKALRIYERCGFEYLSAPLGNSGHFGCELWMAKKI